MEEQTNDLRRAHTLLQEQFAAASLQIDKLQAQVAQLKIQRNDLNDELEREREARFQLLIVRRNWLHSVAHTVWQSLKPLKEK